ncbi:MAG: tetratricopeptide repeat protein [Phycisphaerae bacterium]
MVSLADAQAMLTSGAYQSALKAFERIAADEQEGAHRTAARHGAAQTLIRLGRYEEAWTTLGTPADSDAEGRYLKAQMARLFGRYEEAIGLLREAVAIDPNYAAARRMLGQMYEMLGRRDEAIESFAWFNERLTKMDALPRDAAWLTDAAIGFMRYSVLTQTHVAERTKYVLHEMLQQAYDRLDRTYWPARIAAGDLLREKFSNGEDDGSVSDYVAALRINAHLCEAFVGLGWVRLENWNFEAVEEQAKKALAVDDRFPPALHLLASKFILERRYKQAEAVCDRALKFNKYDIEALAIKAAAAACRYDQALVDALERRVARINPRCARYYQRLGDALGGIRQYAASEAAYRKAIEFEPTNANARAELGLMYMQWGDESQARTALEGAWALDQFNQRTKFTLDLLDSLEEFDAYETAHFIVKSDPTKDPGLAEAVGLYLEDIYADLIDDYAYPLKQKTIIELFPSSKAFAVRITGKPWIHTVGACTGRVIALTSPHKRPGSSGTYNLASVLKHEFTHTVTLAATHNRIPHWFTEGLAVYQEDAPRSFAWRRLLAEAARRNELFTLESINWGFIRPRKPTDRQMAYAQSEWMCEYIVERFGYDVLNKMLARFRDMKTPRQVFVEILGVEPEAFTSDFVAWARKQVQAWGFDMTPPEDADALREAVQEHQEDAALWGRLARAEFDAASIDTAVEAARQAIKLDPKNADGLEVYCSALVMAMEQMPTAEERADYYDELLKSLPSLAEAAPDNWTAPKYLAEIYLAREQYDKAIEPLTRLQRLCPADPASWRGLAGVYLERDDWDAARAQLLELARLDENDAEVRSQLGRIFRHRDAPEEARYWYRQSLFIDPFSVSTNVAYADLTMQMGDRETAFRTYRLLTLLSPDDVSFLEKAALAAVKAGHPEAARRLAEQAVRLAPDSAVRAILD